MAAKITCSTAILAEKSIVQILHWQHWRFSQALLQGSFTSKRWLSSKAETWNVTKNKILKLVNSIKADFLVADINLNINYSGKEAPEKARFMDDALKTRGIIYLVVVSPYHNFWLRACHQFVVVHVFVFTTLGNSRFCMYKYVLKCWSVEAIKSLATWTAI